MASLDINTDDEIFKFVPKRFEVELGFHIIREKALNWKLILNHASGFAVEETSLLNFRGNHL